MMSHHTRLREKNGDLHLLVRFGHRTKAAKFFICTYLSLVKRKAIIVHLESPLTMERLEDLFSVLSHYLQYSLRYR